MRRADKKLNIAFLPQFLTFNPHFVRNRQPSKSRISPHACASDTHDLCRGLVVPKTNPHFTTRLRIGHAHTPTTHYTLLTTHNTLHTIQLHTTHYTLHTDTHTHTTHTHTQSLQKVQSNTLDFASSQTGFSLALQALRKNLEELEK